MVSEPSKSKRSKKTTESVKGSEGKSESSSTDKAARSAAPPAAASTKKSTSSPASAPGGSLFPLNSAENAKDYERIVRPAAEFATHTSVADQLKNGLTYGPAYVHREREREREREYDSHCVFLFPLLYCVVPKPTMVLERGSTRTRENSVSSSTMSG
jgi:hypothetical protein